MAAYHSNIGQEIRQGKPFHSIRQEAGIALLRTADLLSRLAGKVVEMEDLSIQQYNVLRILRGARPAGLPTLEIGNRMVTAVPGVTRLIDRLEQRNLVSRDRSKIDRRQVFCKLSAEGNRMLSRLDPHMDKLDDELLKGLRNDQLSELLKMLDVIRADLADRSERKVVNKKG